ncbi:MAG: phage head closure protein [Rhizobiaceae bacterium]
MRSTFIDAGMLRHELSLQAAVATGDGTGGYAESWVEIATVFARLVPVAVDSLFRADQRLERVTHEITIRHRDDVASGMRFERQGRTFLILTVSDPDETGRYLICTTREDGR